MSLGTGFIYDVITILVDAGVGTFPNGTIFASTKSLPPAQPAPGPFISVIETGGSGPSGTHNAAAAGLLPGYVRPNAQIVVRANSATVAKTKAEEAYSALHKAGQRSQLINGVWWVRATMMQEPFDGGIDGSGRATFIFNIAVEKRPNAAMS